MFLLLEILIFLWWPLSTLENNFCFNLPAKLLVNHLWRTLVLYCCQSDTIVTGWLVESISLLLYCYVDMSLYTCTDKLYQFISSNNKKCNQIRFSIKIYAHFYLFPFHTFLIVCVNIKYQTEINYESKDCGWKERVWKDFLTDTIVQLYWNQNNQPNS